MQGQHILVVEDDTAVRALLRACFEDEGAVVSEAASLADAMNSITAQPPDLVTLDIGLGGDDGLNLLRHLRRDRDTPVIMISGKGDVIDKVVGLELGADDYLAKPFHVREVIARAKTVMRRYVFRPPEGPETDTGRTEGTLVLDGLFIDLARMSVKDRTGRDCNLTTSDFKLLSAFLSHAERPLSRDRLMDLIDGPEWVPLDRTIDNQVARLRKKIERDAAHPVLIKTVRGIGYMLTERAGTMAHCGSSTA